ncbi:sensor histidine kinase [Oscillatoria salina]|uniref:sensor histidine kinase n=1 Tax=Oscillatoria salina TaxID=331517 RepID=UPI0013BBF346|nr:ATP-binding protein [Oscillatoria salina]MBZ8179144.1 response regulator [Oscillatoria salina IIICB1]NET88071.1 response regulator [Kamptonema sp. SIO1D9]
MLRILLVDDNPDDRLLCVRELKREFAQLEIEQIIDPQGLEAAITADKYDLVVTDYQLRWSNGLKVLQAVKKRDRFRPVVMFTNTGTQEIAVEAMKAGLDDYVVKSPKHFVRLPVTVRSVWRSSQLKRRTAELELRFQSLLNNLDVGVFRTNLAGELLEANAAFLQIIGVDSLSEAQQLDLSQLYRTEIASKQQRELELQQPEGKKIWLRVKQIKIEIDGKSFLDGIVEDISDRRQAELAIRELNQTLEQRVSDRTNKLKEVNEELQAFAYSVSHDLQEPLRAIQGFSSIFLQDYAQQLDSEGQNYARRLRNAAQRLTEMVQDLLDYTRITRNKFPVEPVDLSSVVEQVLNNLEVSLQERKAEIIVESPLPVVLANEAILIQVLANILTNAIKFVNKNNLPKVRIRTDTRGEMVRIWVEDNGIGIEADKQQQIFRVFERLHGVESYPGTGIGLAIARKGIERLGGKIGVESRVNQGSKFWLELTKIENCA